MNIRKPTPAGAVLTVVVLAISLALVPAALAGKSGGGGGGKKPPPTSGTTYAGSFAATNPVMVKDANGDGLPNAGDTVTFNITSAAPYPFVQLTCFQNGTQVMQESEGFYSGWLWGTNFPLSGMVWTGGAASCTAKLYSVSYSGTTEGTEATLTFQVGA